MKVSPSITIELLNKQRHDRSNFSCGVLALDLYLQRQAAQDVDKRAAAVYVALMTPPTLVGYYTLSQFSIELTQLNESLSKRLPRYPVLPATLLGRLAVVGSMHSQGLGQLLLMDALHRALDLSHNLASVGVIVDAKDNRAANFYRRFGFSAIPTQPNRLFLSMNTIQQMF